MAKCIALWCGSDSTGRSVEVAKSADGSYFSRAYEYNGYQKSWTKWCFEDDIKHPISYINAYDNERYFWNNDKSPYFNIVEWGFMNLRGGLVEDCRYRLPNIKAA